jgi:hypothetical protein
MLMSLVVYYSGFTHIFSKDKGVYLLKEDTNSWYISIVDPHQKTEKILYRVRSTESQGPPSNGWTTVTKHWAVDPPATVITEFPW